MTILGSTDTSGIAVHFPDIQHQLDRLCLAGHGNLS
jgi:hypothetical protein